MRFQKMDKLCKTFYGFANAMNKYIGKNSALIVTICSKKYIILKPTFEFSFTVINLSHAPYFFSKRKLCKYQK